MGGGVARWSSAIILSLCLSSLLTNIKEAKRALTAFVPSTFYPSKETDKQNKYVKATYQAAREGKAEGRTNEESPSRHAALTQHAAEPDGQILLHGHQGGFMPHCQPLVILEDVGEAGAVPLGQRAARAPGAPGAQQRGIELLPEPHLDTREGIEDGGLASIYVFLGGADTEEPPNYRMACDRWWFKPTVPPHGEKTHY